VATVAAHTPVARRRFRPGRALRYLILSAGAVLFVAPFLYMVSSSFQPLSEIFSSPPRWIPDNPTLQNYRDFFGSGHSIGRWIINSAFTTVTITVLQLFFSSLVAYTFAKRTFPGRDFLFFLGLATMMLPVQVTLIPNYLILKAVPLFGGNDIMGVGGHGWLDSYWGIIVPNLVGGLLLAADHHLQPRAVHPAAGPGPVPGREPHGVEPDHGRVGARRPAPDRAVPHLPAPVRPGHLAVGDEGLAWRAGSAGALGPGRCSRC
jgi:hypothetical protein